MGSTNHERVSSIKAIIYTGPKSRKVAKILKNKYFVPTFSQHQSFGMDKNKCLYLFDSKTDKKRKVMINQSITNKTDYPFSVAIFRLSCLKSIVEQIKSDYFEKFERNIFHYGFPWGEIRKKDKLRDNAISLINHKNRIAKDLFSVFRNSGVLEISKEDSWAFVQWVKKSEKQEVSLFVMVCPDYSFSSDKDILRYSLDNKLSGGIGLVAVKSLEFLSYLNEIIAKHKLKIKVIVGIADYEDHDENLKRLNETKQSFKDKIKKSIRQINLESKRMDLNCQVVGIREHFGERLWSQEWEESRKIIKEELEKLSDNELKKMIFDRKILYSRWFPKIKDKEVLERMIDHGTEYTTCGYLFSNEIDNLIILGANSIDMSLYYRLRQQKSPVLYITKVHK
ncbi:hypothetical protein CMI41_02045 [Candidatus Pacearchaeota archaeon]|nr:hypothetical protein [Candidatus Pacearchaeota archaeon]|tara:strand:+ start:8049 stop:9233 length:1185 start_codon:yes stop_codon:yes gene_type:complete